jgi:class 3 adenylate cyclase/tetratricopeptide (TPR) repeat protein
VLIQCPKCGSEVGESAQFCEACGAPTGLDDRGAPEAAVSPPAHLTDRIRAGRAGLEGERKQVTILFADLVASMELAQRIDPEDWRSIMDRFFQLLADGVHELEGTVNSFTGDGIMAIFGAPIAHEDHARRACLAALKLQQDVAIFAKEFRRSHGRDLAIRIGLNSGEVVVGTIGDRGDMTYTAIGHTVGLAQRMEQSARQGGICLSPSTAALVRGYFRLREPAVREIKGAGQMESFELEGLAAAQGPIDVAQSRGLTPLIGRSEEVRTLESAFEASLAGPGQLVGIVGEPGVGKSRLCFEIAERCRARGIPVFQVAAQAHERGVPLLPVLTLLRSYFEIADVASDVDARRRVESRLDWLDERLVDEAPLLCDFLGIADPQRPVERMDVEARQRRLLDLVRRLIYAQSVREPALTIFDDLHWIDPASEAFLLAYAEAAQGTRGLTVLSFRPDYSAPWMSRSYYRQIPLAALRGQNERELIAELLGSDPSLADTGELISRRAEGNPFFAEELVRSLAGSGHLIGAPGEYRLGSPVSEAEMPATVQAVLTARIDRLPPERKAVLEAAAVLGKEFHAPLVARLTELEEPALDDELRALVAAEFLFEQTPGPESIYAFRHPLTQEVAYRSQLRERRGPLHAAAAVAIADHYSDQLDERSGLVAHHWELAGDQQEAARWHARAATWSGFNDPGEALRHWRRVVDLSDELPASEERDALGLGARIATLHLGWRLGIGADEADALFREAEGIASKVDNPRLHALLVAGYGAVKGLGQGAVDEYADLARRAVEIGERSRDPELQVVLGTNGYAFALTGAYREGLTVVEHAIELAAGDPRAGAEMPVVGCPYALCHAQKGELLADLGDLAGAERALTTGKAIAREQHDLETLAIGLNISAYLALAAGSAEAALAEAGKGVELSERIGGPWSRVWSWSLLGAAEAAGHNPDRALEALKRANTIATEHRAGEESLAYRLALLAEAELAIGRIERARKLASEALEVVETKTGPPLVLPACLAWTRVELAASEPAHPDRIESILRRALDLVAETGARRYEPLIRVETARLADRLGDQRRRDDELREARRLFTEIGATGHVERMQEVVAR